ncbi:rhomboid family intramembrane serine protease [Lutibacter sp. A64]|uniref:rhomboid family intramembrane serine protease n=1 Tax=Lutibacter sp. A64 TaxID=2918526 RepID=UPI001F066C24|nr:rhomboid family intramembrane serine protease [Lutibacter sp. A64]UMB55256.1 rhomboid family intramembrane serine protease [Lutibacter sp. A64]
MEQQNFKYNRGVVVFPILIICLLWFIYFIEIKFGYNFNKFGIYPQTLSGLKGVLFSPFIHSSTKHLFNNSIPLFVMLGSLYYFYRNIANKVLILGLLLTGLLTWSFARPSYHIGASGVVYLLVSFIFFSGIFRKYYRLTALSLIVVFLYGSMVWYIFPTEERISWEGHLSGFLVGLIFSYFFRKQGPQPEKFQFTENKDFENLFDEHGNYNPPEEEPVTDEKLTVNYEYKITKEKNK